MRKHIAKVNLQGEKVTETWKKKNPNGLIFDSLFERNLYVKLQAAKLDFDFHPESIELLPRFKTFALSRGAKPGFIESTVRPITYTPDFLIRIKGLKIYVETKGYFEDGAKLRYKLTQAKLTKGSYIFVAYNMKEANALLDLLQGKAINKLIDNE